MSKLWNDKLVKFCDEMTHYYMDKYFRSHNMIISSDKYDDIYQEVWMDLLKMRKADPEKDITAGNIEAIVQHKIIDFVRKNKDRSQFISTDELDSRSSLTKEENPDSADAVASQGIVLDAENKAREWLDLIPLNDPDYELCIKWMEFWLEYVGLKDYGIHPTDYGQKNGYTDQALARYLGLSGTGSSRYKRINNKMKSLVKTYLGSKS